MFIVKYQWQDEDFVNNEGKEIFDDEYDLIKWFKQNISYRKNLKFFAIYEINEKYSKPELHQYVLIFDNETFQFSLQRIDHQ